MFSDELFQPLAERIGDISRSGTRNKPLVIVSQPWKGEPSMMSAVEQFEKEVLDMGVPVYRSLRRASRALAKFIEYHRFIERVRIRKE